ncbi:MAG: ATP-dependent Clp protease adapter ClpS [Rhodocyclaceae bacterium]|nr:ATP-dependent Clp protease adapter ClpS [Rhodocyclaceae bacterium]
MNEQQSHREFDNLLEASPIKPPPMVRVVLLNDDFTPMDFVIVVLQKFFGLAGDKATTVMLKVHREGRAVCGIYPRDVAATKVRQVLLFAKTHQHPLACVMEEN